MGSSEYNKSVVRRFMDEVSDGGSIDLLDDLCTADVVNHAARPGLQNGLDSFKVLMRSIHEAQDDRHWTEQQYVSEDDLVVVYGVRAGYWRAADFRGVATPNPGHIATELAHMFRFEDGRIAEHWAVRDDLGMLQQLGVVPAPS